MFSGTWTHMCVTTHSMLYLHVCLHVHVFNYMHSSMTVQQFVVVREDFVDHSTTCNWHSLHCDANTTKLCLRWCMHAQSCREKPKVCACTCQCAVDERKSCL